MRCLGKVATKTLTCLVLVQVGNAIGKGNRHYFVVFLWLELFAMTVSAVVAIAQIRRHVVGESWSASGLVGWPDPILATLYAAGMRGCCTCTSLCGLAVRLL